MSPSNQPNGSRSRLSLLAVLALLAGCAPASVADPSTSASASADRPTATTIDTSATPTSAAATPSPSPAIVVGPGEPWLAFQTGTAAGYGVHLARPDGSDLHRWSTEIPGTQEHPDWSPDGSRILVNAVDGSGIEDLWVAAVDGSGAERILDCETPCLWVDEAAWSPDGTRIAFQRLVAAASGPGFVSTLELLEVATGTTEVILTMPTTEVVLAPRWSPDGDRIVVEVIQLATDDVNADMTGGAIGVVDLTAAEPAVTRLNGWETFANSPDWSPVGELLVFSQPSGLELQFADLVVVEASGDVFHTVTALTDQGGAATHPAFTPDGEGIVFVLTRPGRSETVMATIEIDGTGLASATGGEYRDGTHPRPRPID